MKPSLLCKMHDSTGTYLITTTGGRRLTATPVFGDTDWGPIYFRINKYEKVHASSVKNAEIILDYYYSASQDAAYGHCTTDGICYTEAVSTGRKPVSQCDDLKFVVTKTQGDIKCYRSATQANIFFTALKQAVCSHMARREKMDSKELIAELREAVHLVKESGSIGANNAYRARASAIAKLLNILER